MLFSLISALFFENNARNTRCMSGLIFKKCLDLRKNIYSRTSSWCYQNTLSGCLGLACSRVCRQAGAAPASERRTTCRDNEREPRRNSLIP